MTVKQKVEMACTLREISITELAARIGTSQQNLSKRLKVGKFTQEEMEKIAEALGAKYISVFEFPDGTKI